MRKHPRKSEKPEPEEQPIEPEMEKTPEEDETADGPSGEPPKEKRVDDL